MRRVRGGGHARRRIKATNGGGYGRRLFLGGPMETYHIRIKATYDNVITAGSFAEASEQAENEIAPGWISEEIHVTKEGSGENG